MNKKLAIYIFSGLVLGAIVGLMFPSFGVAIQPVGKMFINLIEMVIIPLVFSALVVGASGIADMKKMGRIGLKSIIWFEFITTIILVLGLILANVLHPGLGVHIQQANVGDYSAAKGQKIDIISMIVNIPPSNLVKAMYNGSMLSIVFFATILGLAIASVTGEAGKVAIRFFEGISQATFTIIRWVMQVAPIGVFALSAYAAGNYGIKVFLPLAKAIGVMYLGLAIVLCVLFPLVSKFILHVPFFKLFRGILDLFIIAFSTASSEAVMPQLIEFVEEIGVPKSISSFVIPLGLSWNDDGTSLYLSVAAMFVAQLGGLHLSISQEAVMILMLVVTSKGMAGVPMAGFVVLLTTATAVGLPMQGIALLAAVDRVLDMARTAVNVIGHPVAAIAVAKWEKEFDESKLQQFLKNGKRSQGISESTNAAR